MPDENGPQPGGGQPRDPWAPPEQGPSLDKPAVPPQQGQPSVPPAAGAVHESPEAAGATGAQGPGAVPPPPAAPSGSVPPPPGSIPPPPPPAPGSYGYPGNASGQPPGAGFATGPGAYPQGPGYGFPQYPGGPAPYGGPNPGWPGQPMPSNGMGIAAMVLGIVSVVGFCLYGIVSLITGILAIVFAVKGRRKADNGEATNRGAATSGLILGWIGAVLGLLTMVLFIVLIVIGYHEAKDEPFRDGDPFATSLVIEH